MAGSRKTNEPEPVPATATGAKSRRRGAELEGALLDAVWELVWRVGYANLTMESAATQAGTSKAVLYRRWPSRAALVLAALRHHFGALKDRVPDTGNLRDDVLSVLRYLHQRFREIGRPDIVHGLLADIGDVPRDLFQILPQTMLEILVRAVARGEIAKERVTPRIASVPGNLLRHDLLIGPDEVSDAHLMEIVDDIFLPLLTAPSPRTGPARR